MGNKTTCCRFSWAAVTREVGPVFVALTNAVLVRCALELLAGHPLLGRAAEAGRRELVLSRSHFCDIAKYRWVPAEQPVLILALRHQREAGYSEEN